MKVLVVGAGVIGSVYGAHLGAAGHAVSVQAHGSRTRQVAGDGIRIRDALTGETTTHRVEVVDDASRAFYDLVLVAVRGDQLAAATAQLRRLAGQPTVLFFGNNPAGRAAIDAAVPGRVCLGFPGIGGALIGTEVRYVRIPQQPTALPTAEDPRLAELESTLRLRGFAVQRVDDMDGWLAYHAVFVACIAAALYRCDTDPALLAHDRATLDLMCRAVTEGFAALRTEGVSGLPRNLSILHHPLLRSVAVAYWARTMRSPMGELCFAAHARHAQPEMRALGKDFLARLSGRASAAHLRPLLQQ